MKKKAKTAKKGRQLTAKQTKKIRGGMGVPTGFGYARRVKGADAIEEGETEARKGWGR